MRKIPVNKLKPGMVLACKVRDGRGGLLLDEDSVLNNRRIARLKKAGISRVFIKDFMLEDVEATDFISDETREEAIKILKKAFQHLVKGSEADLASVEAGVQKIIWEVTRNTCQMISLTDVRTYDSFIFAHSVNVCALSIYTGVLLGLTEDQLRILGLGALFHDIGKTMLDHDLLYKPGPLTDEEMAQVRKHPIAGYEILRRCSNLDPLVARVALEHHERLDGSGYPKGLKGKKIHLFSRIVAVVNVFDALISDRPYRRAYLPHEAAAIIENEAASKFDPEIVRVFMENVALYPIGTMVELSNGEVGMVIDVNKGQQARPIVRLLPPEGKKEAGEWQELDLSKQRDLYIVRVLEDQHFPDH